MLAVTENLMMARERLFNPREPKFHRMTSQALHGHDMCVALRKEIVAGEIAHRLMIGADTVMAHKHNQW